MERLIRLWNTINSSNSIFIFLCFWGDSIIAITLLSPCAVTLLSTYTLIVKLQTVTDDRYICFYFIGVLSIISQEYSLFHRERLFRHRIIFRDFLLAQAFGNIFQNIYAGNKII